PTRGVGARGVIADHTPLPEPQEEPAPALQGAMKRSTPPPRNWWRLTGGKRQGRDPARDALKAMVPWVDWLVGRYGLAHVVPPCWWAHEAMVEELSALVAAWLGAYENPARRRWGRLARAPPAVPPSTSG